jgi:hypothetical protein
MAATGRAVVASDQAEWSCQLHRPLRDLWLSNNNALIKRVAFFHHIDEQRGQLSISLPFDGGGPIIDWADVRFTPTNAVWSDLQFAIFVCAEQEDLAYTRS